MKEQITLEAFVRTGFGKQHNRRLRREEFIPAVVYRRGKETVNLKVARKELTRVLKTGRGGNVLIALTVKEEAKAEKESPKERMVLVKELQHDPIRGDVLHVDFHEISLTEKLKVNVPVKTKGEAIGVKQDGGILEHALWEVEAECLPTEIPDQIEVDVSALKIGDAVHIKDLLVPKGVQILQDPDLTVFVVKPPAVEAAPAEAVAGEEVAEPEVITERKPKEGEEEETAEGAKKKEEPKKKPEAKAE